MDTSSAIYRLHTTPGWWLFPIIRISGRGDSNKLLQESFSYSGKELIPRVAALGKGKR